MERDKGVGLVYFYLESAVGGRRVVDGVQGVEAHHVLLDQHPLPPQPLLLLADVFVLQQHQVVLPPLQALAENALFLDLRPVPAVELVHGADAVKVVKILLGLDEFPTFLLEAPPFVEHGRDLGVAGEAETVLVLPVLEHGGVELRVGGRAPPFDLVLLLEQLADLLAALQAPLAVAVLVAPETRAPVLAVVRLHHGFLERLRVELAAVVRDGVARRTQPLQLGMRRGLVRLQLLQNLLEQEVQLFLAFLDALVAFVLLLPHVCLEFLEHLLDAVLHKQLLGGVDGQGT